MIALNAATASPQKLSFEKGGEFIRETGNEVEQYLSSRRVRLRGRLQLYAKSAVAFGLTLVSWLLLVLVVPSAPGALLCLVGLAAGTVLTALCVQHDANHGAYFRTRRANHLLGWTTDSLLGFSSYAWRVKHNVAHHTYTNVAGFDDDINQAPFARLTPEQQPRRWYRLQHYYLWPLYSLMVLRWQTGGDIAPLVRGRIGNSALRLPKRWDLVGLVAGKLIFLGWAVVVPLLVYPWWAVAAGYAAVTMVASLITATTFQLAHCVEEADFATADELRDDRRPWAVHEVETTVDFCPRNPFLTWVLGGLNYQIEHHLFPRVPHTHYREIAAIVRRNCAKHGIRYTAQPSLHVALRSHFRHLRRMGRLGLAHEIEMG
jgi:linoleoyl-CoA desaturase